MLNATRCKLYRCHKKHTTVLCLAKSKSQALQASQAKHAVIETYATVVNGSVQFQDGKMYSSYLDEVRK